MPIVQDSVERTIPARPMNSRINARTGRPEGASLLWPGTVPAATQSDRRIGRTVGPATVTSAAPVVRAAGGGEASRSCAGVEGRARTNSAAPTTARSVDVVIATDRLGFREEDLPGP